jgi:hypothetical protein
VDSTNQYAAAAATATATATAAAVAALQLPDGPACVASIVLWYSLLLLSGGASTCLAGAACTTERTVEPFRVWRSVVELVQFDFGVWPEVLLEAGSMVAQCADMAHMCVAASGWCAVRPALQV